MGLHVDRQAALGWLGIDGFRPSGRVPFPAVEPAVDDVDIDVLAPSDDASLVGDGQATEMAEPIDTPPRSSTAATSESAAPADIPAEPAETVATEPQSARPAPTDRLSVTAGSPHRALAEAIARVAGLACETDLDGDVLMLGGERWELSALAGDGQAKRRLWRVLAERARRPRA